MYDVGATLVWEGVNDYVFFLTLLTIPLLPVTFRATGILPRR